MKKISIYNKDRQFQRQIGAPLKCVTTPRKFPLIGSASMTLSLNDPAVPALLADGSRILIEMNGEHLISGPVDETQTNTEAGTVKVTVIDDSWVLTKILGWQDPTASIYSQGAQEYGIYIGTAGAIFRHLVQQNGINRLKIPGLKLGSAAPIDPSLPGGALMRMHPLPDRLYPAVEMAGIGVRVRQSGTDLLFETYRPRVYPAVLSVKGGTLKKAVHTRRRPSASRAVIGGPGEGTFRYYRQVIDHDREAQFGFCGEVFVDARDIKNDGTPSSLAQAQDLMDARGREALIEAGKVDGLSVTLAGSSVFTYGSDGIRVGDEVPVDVGDGRIITAPVREADLEWVTPDYVKVTPIIGDQEDPDRRQAKSIAELKASQRREERN